MFSKNHYRTIRELYIITCMWHSLCSTAQNHHSKYDMWMVVKHKKAIYTRTTHQIIPYFYIFFFIILQRNYSYIWSGVESYFLLWNFCIWWGWLKNEPFHSYISITPCIPICVQKQSPSANRWDNMKKNSLVNIFVLPLHWIINNINFLLFFSSHIFFLSFLYFVACVRDKFSYKFSFSSFSFFASCFLLLPPFPRSS